MEGEVVEGMRIETEVACSVVKGEAVGGFGW